MSIQSEHEIDDETLELLLTTGDRVQLRLDADAVRVFDAQSAEIGRIVFASSEMPDGGDYVNVWRITNMFIEGGGGRYKRQGIGTRAVQYFLWANSGDFFEITENDGQRREDGSHLTGDGVGFMAHLSKLRDQGKL